MEDVYPTAQAAESAIRILLKRICENPDREGLVDTPARVVRSFEEMTCGYKEYAGDILKAIFSEHCDEIVLLRGVRFSSLCEHHLLPFTGVATVGYLPNDQVVGISKLARLVHCYARRLQVQERLTQQIAAALQEHLKPRGVGVVIRAHHHCMGCRGVEQPDAEMVTSAMTGLFRENAATKAEFMSLAKG